MRAHRADLPAAPAIRSAGRKAETPSRCSADSHSTHWRAAVASSRAGARERRVDDRNLCPFDVARTKRHDRCKGWTRGGAHWLANDPRSRRCSSRRMPGPGVQAVRGQTQREKRRSRRRERAWKRGPEVRGARGLCPARCPAQPRRHRRLRHARDRAPWRPPALRCARPRGKALTPDPQAEAADLDPADLVRAIDLTALMCDEQRCPPVVGGALVIKDIGHMTRTFSRTLGPFLGRAVDELRGRRVAARRADPTARSQEDA